VLIFVESDGPLQTHFNGKAFEYFKFRIVIFLVWDDVYLSILVPVFCGNLVAPSLGQMMEALVAGLGVQDYRSLRPGLP